MHLITTDSARYGDFDQQDIMKAMLAILLSVQYKVESLISGFMLQLPVIFILL